MSTEKRWKRRRPGLGSDQLLRLVILVGAVLALAVVTFGGYYYWDRYVHLGDESPADQEIARLEQAIRDNPSDPAPRVTLAEYYLNQEKYPQAVEQSGQVLEKFPEDQGALLINGVAYTRQAKYAEAVAPLEKFVLLRKDQPMASVDNLLETAYYFLGESYLKLDRAEEALRALEAAVAINATDADALYLAGLAQQALGRPELAVQYYFKAVRLVPNFTEAYSAMIDSYTALDEPDYVAYARGMQAFSLKDYSTARTHLEFATQSLPDFGPAFLGLALTYEQLGELRPALAAAQRALELNPNDFAAQQAVGRIQAALDAQGG